MCTPAYLSSFTYIRISTSYYLLLTHSATIYYSSAQHQPRYGNSLWVSFSRRMISSLTKLFDNMKASLQ